MSPEAARTRVAQGGYLLWEDGEPVSMAGFRTAVGVGRVGPVWTPPDRRGKGYAAAVTRAATRAILDVGAVAVLYTDLANPTSNGVYRRLGYRMVARRPSGSSTRRGLSAARRGGSGPRARRAGRRRRPTASR